MGLVTDANQAPIIYDHTKKSFTIREGIIFAKNQKIYDVCNSRIKKELGKTIPELHKEIL